MVPRMLLGARLRSLREAAGYSRVEAGRALRASSSKIGRLERGDAGVDPGMVLDLLPIYGVDDEAERETLLALAEQANAPGWWQGYHDVLPHWARQYAGAEQSARLIRTFETQLVPPLLQTPDYAREILRLQRPGIADAELDRRVELRVLRQRILRRRPRPTNLWAVIDESVLRRTVGERATMREQLEFLIETANRPNVTLQIAPFDIGGRTAATGGPLTLVRFSQRGLPDMVYLEQLDSAVYHGKRDEIELHWHVFNTLVTEAALPEYTPNILRRFLRDL